LIIQNANSGKRTANSQSLLQYGHMIPLMFRDIGDLKKWGRSPFLSTSGRNQESFLPFADGIYQVDFAASGQIAHCDYLLADFTLIEHPRAEGSGQQSCGNRRRAALPADLNHDIGDARFRQLASLVP
jgi:hypothetical protein